MKSLKFNKIVESTEECINLGVEFSKFISNGDIIILEGELGSGKTTFVKGVLKGFNYASEVTSPTFTLINEYHADKKIIHIDFYRENKAERWKLIGLDDYLGSNENITIIEWGNLHSQLLPKDIITINFEHIDEQKRKIILD